MRVRQSPVRVWLAVAVVASAAGMLGASRAAAAGPTGRTIVADVQRFWTREMPRVYGRRYLRVPPSRVAGVTEARPPAFACFGLRGVALYREVLEGNAIGGLCDEGPVVAWDASPDAIVAQIRDQFGRAGLAAVMAHEVGHVVQAQIGLNRRKRTIVLEQQADCFAGAYFAWSRRGSRLATAGRPTALADASSAMLLVRDPVGTSASEEDAHGSGFDRLRAFQDGLAGGARRCARYATRLPRLFQVGFRKGERRTGGNLPLARVTQEIVPELNRYYASVETGYPAVALGPASGEPDCAMRVPSTTVCPAGRVVAIDQRSYVRLSRRVGDASVVVLLAMAWSDAGRGSQVPDPATRYDFNACRAGGFFRAASDGSVDGNTLTLSAGDLDEALITLLRETRDVRPGDTVESIFAFRTGVTRGVRACGELLAG